MMRLLLALVLVVVVGLLSRLRPIGWWVYDKSLGDGLYAAAVYLVLALLLRRRPAVIAVLALGLCLAIECFQATGVPACYAHLAPVRWLLGTTFSWHDIVCYVIGVAAFFGIDVLLLRGERPA